MADRGWGCYVATPNDSPLAARLKHAAHLCLLPNPVRSFSLKAILSLWRFCKQHDIQVIDCHSSRAHSLAMLLKLFYPSLQLVVHRRVDFPPSQDVFGRYKYQSKRVAKFVAISDAIAHVMEAHGVPKSNIQVVKSAVDHTIFSDIHQWQARQTYATEFSISPDLIWLICPAAFTEQKDHDTLIRAVAEVRKQKSDFCLLLAGTGPLERQVQTLVKDLQLSDCVYFLGFRQDIPSLLKASDILTLSSRFEGLGTTILDGIHAECAIVATQVGGIPEMIVHQQSGWLSPKESPTDFAANLLEALNNPASRRAITLRARQQLPHEFTLDHMVQQNLAVYRALVGKT